MTHSMTDADLLRRLEGADVRELPLTDCRKALALHSEDLLVVPGTRIELTDAGRRVVEREE